MKRIEMFSTVCLDTSCYSTWNYFSQGSCHITHKVPVEQQHCSTELVQCTHKGDHFYPLSLPEPHLLRDLQRKVDFWSVGLGFFSFLTAFLSPYQCVLWAKAQCSAIPAEGAAGCVCWEAAQAQHCPFWVCSHVFSQSHLFQDVDHRMEILVLNISGMQRTNNSSYRLCLDYCLKMGLNKELS